MSSIEECGASISVTGYTDERGYTEYVIETQLTEGGGRHRVQHRVTRFRELHGQIQSGLGLPAFPVANRLFHSETVKQQRKETLQAYLRAAAAAAKRHGVGLPWAADGADESDAASSAAAALTQFLGVATASPTSAPTPAPGPIPAPSSIPADLLALLRSLSLEDEAAALEAAGAWCMANEPHSIGEIGEYELVDDFVGVLGLPPAPAEKLRTALLPSSDPEPHAEASSLDAPATQSEVSRPTLNALSPVPEAQLT